MTLTYATTTMEIQILFHFTSGWKKSAFTKCDWMMMMILWGFLKQFSCMSLLSLCHDESGSGSICDGATNWYICLHVDLHSFLSVFLCLYHYTTHICIFCTLQCQLLLSHSASLLLHGWALGITDLRLVIYVNNVIISELQGNWVYLSCKMREWFRQTLRSCERGIVVTFISIIIIRWNKFCVIKFKKCCHILVAIVVQCIWLGISRYIGIFK